MFNKSSIFLGGRNVFLKVSWKVFTECGNSFGVIVRCVVGKLALNVALLYHNFGSWLWLGISELWRGSNWILRLVRNCVFWYFFWNGEPFAVHSKFTGISFFTDYLNDIILLIILMFLF